MLIFCIHLKVCWQANRHTEMQNFLITDFTHSLFNSKIQLHNPLGHYIIEYDISVIRFIYIYLFYYPTEYQYNTAKFFFFHLCVHAVCTHRRKCAQQRALCQIKFTQPLSVKMYTAARTLPIIKSTSHCTTLKQEELPVILKLFLGLLSEKLDILPHHHFWRGKNLNFK